jgi:hypothetical protein
MRISVIALLAGIAIAVALPAAASSHVRHRSPVRHRCRVGYVRRTVWVAERKHHRLVRRRGKLVYRRVRRCLRVTRPHGNPGKAPSGPPSPLAPVTPPPVTTPPAPTTTSSTTTTPPPPPPPPPAPPVNSAAPVISGTPSEGHDLTATTGSWSGSPTSFVYQWQDCDSSGTSCKNVGTNSASYALTAADVGSRVRVLVTASNAGGSASATSGPTASVGSGAPTDPVVVAAGDIACAPGDGMDKCKQSLTAELASAQDPTAVLPLGDNQYNSGLLSEYNGAGAYNATWGIFNPIVDPTTGNHEYAVFSTSGGFALAQTAQGYFDYFGAHGALHGSTASVPYYAFNLGTWHIVSLDSNCSDSGCEDSVQGQTTTAQTQWLKADLAAHPAACTLAFWHHPRFSDAWSNDNPGVAPLFAALYNAHADVVVSGHDHDYERFAPQDPSGVATPNGVREFVAGTGGESLFAISTSRPNLQASDQTDFGILVLTLHASSYDWAFKRLDGTVVDSGSSACHGSAAGAPTMAAAGFAGRKYVLRRAVLKRVWPVGTNGPAFSIDARVQSASPTATGRRRLRATILMSRAADVNITVSIHRRHRLSRIASFHETESQLPRAYSRIRLLLPDSPLVARGRARLIVRFAAVDGAGDRGDVVRTTILGNR